MGASVISRLIRLVGAPSFRRDPIGSVVRRIRWRHHCRFRPRSSFRMELLDGRIMFLAPTSASSGIYLNGGFSDSYLAGLLLDFLTPGMVFFDCGAHIGEYSVLAGKAVGSEGRVHSFEPDPRVFDFLIRNVNANRLLNVTSNKVALADSMRTQNLTLHPDATVSALAGMGPRPTNSEHVQVRVTTVDTYATTIGMSRLDALKIDVEGAESALLEGARCSFSEFRPALMVVECHGLGLEQTVTGFANDFGYRVERIHKRGDPYPHVIARRP